eukprot:437024-Pleurochrysis_carterae.AAC.1
MHMLLSFVRCMHLIHFGSISCTSSRTSHACVPPSRAWFSRIVAVVRYLARACHTRWPRSAARRADFAGVVGSVSAGLFCDRVYGGRMIGLTLPIIIANALAFLGWALLCLVESGGQPLWGGALHVIAMATVGFLIATPDSVLGGAASRNLCDYAGASKDVALAAAASGLVNGCGSIGAIVQARTCHARLPKSGARPVQCRTGCRAGLRKAGGEAQALSFTVIVGLGRRRAHVNMHCQLA